MASQVADIKMVKGVQPCFIVDGFNFCVAACEHYFLTHYHSDHITGLSAAFDLGDIYCSAITARLLLHDKGVNEKIVKIVPLNTTLQVNSITNYKSKQHLLVSIDLIRDI